MDSAGLRDMPIAGSNVFVTFEIPRSSIPSTYGLLRLDLCLFRGRVFYAP